MRRALSIVLILFFGLGPLAATLSASDDLRLPSCCRRHGVHHCAMSVRPTAMAEAAPSGKLTLSAPLTCPCFPGYAAAPTTATHALAASPVSLPILLAPTHSPAVDHAAARLSQIRTRAGRGPPASSRS